MSFCFDFFDKKNLTLVLSFVSTSENMIDGVVSFDHYTKLVSLTFSSVCMYASVAIIDCKVKQIVFFCLIDTR